MTVLELPLHFFKFILRPDINLDRNIKTTKGKGKKKKKHVVWIEKKLKKLFKA